MESSFKVFVFPENTQRRLIGLLDTLGAAMSRRKLPTLR